ncbi:S-adenosylmethionine decarboxylase proenzyme 4 [Dichanthelium oligosanthes]|uniref:S-adenosylmethionine decarboxylase proenzyme n=1 Tax=Dichanthelium oligosanthes TaxID=888268 RepID=A0A1E5VV03_9POAL|nr:S-adenosylmethionine decarboxylase proenzyme 4 [Dichanthelium oligosanthes]
MAASGFEGFEKRLELVFSLPSCGGALARHGLRLLPVRALREALEAVQCTVVSAAGNAAFDAYVLSESSLFVYPSRAVLKTCGTTRLLRAVPILLRAAGDELGLTLRSCRYSRGSYLFPEAQPFPHADFADEVRFLDGAVPSGLRFRGSSVMPPSHSRHSQHKWHVYTASTSDDGDIDSPTHFTVEVCMTELDGTLARQFYLTPGDERTSHAIGDAMTAASGLGDVNPRSLVLGYAFASCGYSMNGLDGARYATVHVTPEDGHSYASYECDGAEAAGALASIGKAVAVFRPATVSVSVCYSSTNEGTRASDAAWIWSAVADAVEPLGLACRSRAAEAFPGATTVTYQTFTRAPASLDMNT